MENILKFSMTLISFIVSLYIAKIFVNKNSFISIQKRPERFGSIDGLRGFLAISVFFHHFILTWYWKFNGKWMRPQEDYFQNYGKLGVAIFFMITGFLFITKISFNKKINWIKMYESRFYRILPLYVFAVLVISVLVFIGTKFELKVSLSELFNQYLRWSMFHGSEINQFENTQRIIAGVEWTLKYEWLFYLLLPLVSIIVIKLKGLGGSILLFLCVYIFINPIQIIDFNTKYFLLFAIGGWVSFIKKAYKVPDVLIKNKIFSFITTLLLLLAIFYPNTLDIVHLILISIFFLLVVLGNDMFGVFSLNSSKLLGEISYSIYLLHGVVLYILFTQFKIIDLQYVSLLEYIIIMPLVIIIVLFLSITTYIFIEKPFLELGKKNFCSKKLEAIINYLKIKKIK